MIGKLLTAVVVGLAACSERTPRVAAPGPATALEPAALAAWLAASPDRVLVDLRDPVAFAKAHTRGAVNLQAGYGQFRMRAARFFPQAHELCLAATDPEVAKGLASEAGVPWLNARVTDLAQHGLEQVAQATTTAEGAAAQLKAGTALLIDARTAAEYTTAHVAGAVFVYPDDFAKQAGFLRRDKTVIVMCEAGWRSSLLVSWMDRLGFGRAVNLIGGMKEWRAAGLPVESGSEQEAFK